VTPLLNVFLTILVLIFFATLISLVVNFVRVHKLMNYLKANRYQSWCKITTVGNFGAGGSNPFRIFKYLRSDTDNDDEYINRSKNGVLIGLRYTLFFFLGLISNVIMVIVTSRFGI
jgi:hypothetical protein